MHGKWRSVLKYKERLDINKLRNGEYKLQDSNWHNETASYLLGKYENPDIFIKNGKFGLYAEWG